MILDINQYCTVRTIDYDRQCGVVSGDLKKILALLALHEFCRTQSGQNAEMKPFDSGILDNFRLFVIHFSIWFQHSPQQICVAEFRGLSEHMQWLMHQWTLAVRVSPGIRCCWILGSALACLGNKFKYIQYNIFQYNNSHDFAHCSKLNTWL